MAALGFRGVYDRLYRHYGPQGWWPARSPFEVMLGAVLTQNTAWSNVEKALAGLENAELTSAGAIVDAPHDDLAAAIRPAGYFNVKARRLKALCQAYLDRGGWAAMDRLETGTLREVLLRVHGVGRETADDIVLYAFNRPVFVVDAYTRRIFERLDLLEAGMGYEAVRARFEAALGPDAAVYNEYHALVVQLGKSVCRPRPLCEHCCLNPICPSARSRNAE
ncbi:endonuclease [Ectothiorhodospiraceae bacterium WFHF3C12]|nr:endonuclease [Ectothiorhodospiraceae bacterium WFHF3C12]